MADFDADELGKRLEQLNREQLAALEQLSERVLRELEAARLGPKRADEIDRPKVRPARVARPARKRSNVT